MAFGENAPDLRSKPEGMRDNLKDDVAIRRPVAEPTQCGEAERMSGVVCKVEPALHRIGGIAGVGRPRQAGAR